LLDKVHAGKIRPGEDFGVLEMIIVAQVRAGERAANHSLENQTAFDLLDHFVQRIQGIAQVVEDSHEQNVVKLSGNGINIIDGTLGKFDLQSKHLRGKAGLLEIAIIHVKSQHPAGAPLLERNGMEAAVTADIQHAGAVEV